ncbi:DUF4065 domain-containing protein [Acuticoccus sp. MNP-M23]|uniref:Panacea domain-containing protein n=1 Tax=Acuticoccus sp. MNP-M23 TaxID=3072793 RepID=UPI00281522F9|nr:type II toxin-antitoxin system antitoxin SocA domain-containing protein [Acuticoccus sp. MNP-M23]WMS42529.1 DUF4065 domain-containing protein [Acuticoccus sp. MNP-M23]
MPHDSAAIANEFLRLANAEGNGLTQMQLQKLVYIAHGWSLALLGTPLVNDRIEAWDYGPVIPSLRAELRSYGRSAVSEPIRKRGLGWAPKTVSSNLSDDEVALIQRVYQSYGHMSGETLSRITHKRETPWSNAFSRGQNTTISDDEIVRHYKSLISNRNAT